jgi:Fe-S cluster assembly scaffold protein SufB
VSSEALGEGGCIEGWKWKIQLDKTRYEVTVAENGQLNYPLVIDDNTNDSAQHYCFYVERNAVLVVELLVMRSDIHLTIECILRGQGADARINGAYGLHKSNKAQIYTFQHHQAAHTCSTLVMKGIVHDSAQAYYHGTIRVEKDAYGCDASQENKNMLMSNSARAVSEPCLEVLTNDVRCFHGSATGRCDDEQLFYCATRGIDEKKAQQLLVQAFFAKLFVNETLRELIRRYIFSI